MTLKTDKSTKKIYLKTGDKCYTTGAYIRWNGKNFDLVELDEDTFYDGIAIDFDDNDKPFIDK
jgi:hypothetical protein